MWNMRRAAAERIEMPCDGMRCPINGQACDKRTNNEEPIDGPWPDMKPSARDHAD